MDVGARVGSLLSKRVVELEPIDEHGWKREHVFRARLDDGCTVIVKTGKRWEGQSEYPPAGFLADVAGLRFLSEVAPGLAPRFIASREDVLVLEDVGDGDSLADVLLGSHAGRARATLAALGTSLGRLHAATIGHEDRFDEIRASLPPFENRLGPARFLERVVGGFADVCHDSGVSWGSSEQEDAGLVARTIGDPGPYRAYVHGDPCPDNCRVIDDGVLLLDFEGGRFAHALLDGTYARIRFPTCWCVNGLAEAQVRAFEDAYRTELRRGCRAADDVDAFEREMTLVAASWMLDGVTGMYERVRRDGDREWGIATLTQRILARLEAFTAMAERSGTVPALARATADLHAALWERWPEARELPPYPAFR